MQRTYPETHRQGSLSVENLHLIMGMDHHNVDFGVQIASNGQAWICINGIAFIRFKPALVPDKWE